MKVPPADIIVLSDGLRHITDVNSILTTLRRLFAIFRVSECNCDSQTRRLDGMKSIQLAAAIILTSVFAPAQSNQSETHWDSLYAVALKASILQMEKEYGHMDDTVLVERTLTDYRHMVVEEDPLITKGLPTEFENHFVAYLDSQALVQRYRKSGKSYAALVIQPMQNEGRILKIGVVVYWINYKKGRLRLELSDWSNVEFHYDCDKQQFIVSSVKLGGI
jgi:hypothetical protein